MLLIVGFIMLGIGVALLTGSGGGGFFVFPFFFFSGDTGFLMPVLIIASLVIMMFFFWWANNKYPEDARFTKYQDQINGTLKIGSICQFCGSLLPENAMFCSACGNQVDDGFSNNDSF
jgi:hypothetical protein